MLTKEEKITLETYNKIAQEWAASRSSPKFWATELKKFKKYLPTPAKVIDIGCGGGRDSLFFTKNKYDYLGIDISKPMIAIARKSNPKAEFSVKSLYDLDFPKNTFDGFWASASLLHVPRMKIKSVLRKIVSIVKAGGMGFIVVKEGKGAKMLKMDEAPGKGLRYFVYYSNKQFNQMLTSVGFKILEFYKYPSDFDKKRNFLIYFVKKL